MLECKDCCLYNTDACRYGKYALDHNMSIQCDDFIVEHNKAYQQGRADVINEIYAKFMNEDKDSILEWLQDNITDERSRNDKSI